MNKRTKIWLTLGLMSVLAIVLSGCAPTNYGAHEEITANTDGFWKHYFVWPMAWLIREISHLVGNDFGIGIIITTLLVRLVILPLMIKQTKSMGGMQVIQPEMVKLREKYSSKDQETQQKLQQEMMKLYQEHNVNPLAGCLPILIQMPILIAFYNAIIYTPAIFQHTFLWFNLGKPDPFFILPIMSAVLTYLQQKISMAGQEDNPQMKIMLYVFPIMIFIMGVTLPSALSLYWVVGYIFSIIVTVVIMKPMREKIKVQTEATLAAKRDKEAAQAAPAPKKSKKKR
ncbi:membrane protein insertase YidC [Exiguobacterium acetylicum]|uniref:membrane protein insertase YidC n=1 Tax=Exiguobacterium TaxID=33986 RepID=UPI0004519A67|nr:MULTISPECIES: membrane protein insertase YidC [Exiguobacterium]EZP58868.1 Membrane protein YidC [Exiguobacterium sp. RIT341]KQS36460.1 OxaA precursor [Exiguobacterium sp. Leaf196]MDQ6468542.1 membrane protein insertase YidC [Exiguobacterium acetylicum]HAB32676.1 membrane protein insertase YidC [Exiguobacterium sp.]HAZ39655.1 membrane protein insertase YidC [Exiguobacterium sp.]